MAVSKRNRHNQGGKNDLGASSFASYVPPRSRRLPKTGPHRGRRLPGGRGRRY